MIRMKKIRIIGVCTVALAMALSASALFADYCPDCAGKARILSAGTCSECGGYTASGANKICPDCSKKLGVCEDCGRKLDAAPPVATDTEAKIADLIAKLGSDNFDTREAAQKELLKLGKDAIPFLKKSAEETNDPEIRNRCKLIVRDYEVERWNRLLVKAFTEDKAFLARLQELGLEGPYSSDKTFGKLDKFVPVEIADIDSILTEPMRFFTFDQSALIRTDGLSIASEPPTILRIAIRENGTALAVGCTNRNRDGLKEMKGYLKPAANRDEALKTGVAVARLLAFCMLCNNGGNVSVDPAKCTIAGTPETGYNLVVPPEAVTPNESSEGAVLTFDKDGTLIECKRTGHKNGHM
jgi:hypothetical protein